MNATERRLLDAVLADPESDTPRLVLADWLEEQGDGDHAEFIRDCIWMHNNHTDCPVRLLDLAAGRPVPLRCGVCEYCQRRRRAEKFYGKHRWADLPAYAVCFEPTPLDGTMPTGPGVTLLVRRGFIEVVHTTLQQWLGGGKCSACDKGKQYDLRGDTGLLSRKCPACHGTGTLPGIGPALVRQQPVQRVVTEKRPAFLTAGQQWWWLCENVERSNRDFPYILPVEVYCALPAVMHPTEQAARDALECHALIQAARNERRGEVMQPESV